MVPKARIGNGNGSSKQGDNNNVDDWQSCWVDEAEDARDGGQFIRRLYFLDAVFRQFFELAVQVVQEGVGPLLS